jgi:hypothetical protein
MVMKAILEYKGNLFPKVTDIRIIIYQPDMLAEYHKAAKLAENSKNVTVGVADVKGTTCYIV